MGIINIKYKNIESSISKREDVIEKVTEEKSPKRYDSVSMNKIYQIASTKFRNGTRIKAIDGEEHIIHNITKSSNWRSNPITSEDDIVYLSSDIDVLVPVWKNGEWAEIIGSVPGDFISESKSIYFVDYENTQDIFAFKKSHPESEIVLMFGLLHTNLKVNTLTNLSGRKIHCFKNNFAGPNVADSFLMYIVGLFESRYDLDVNFVFVSKDKMFSKMIADIKQMNNMLEKRSRKYHSIEKI